MILLGLLTAFRFLENITKKDVCSLFLLEMVNAIPYFLYYLAIQLMSVAAGIAIQFLYVWLVVLFQRIIDLVLPKKRTLISAALVIAGSVMSSGMANELLSGSGKITVTGVIYALACAFFYTTFLFGNGRTVVRNNPILRAFIESCGILTIVTIVQIVTGGMEDFDFIGSLPGCSLLGLLMTEIPITCIARASSRLSGGQVAILTPALFPESISANSASTSEKVLIASSFFSPLIFKEIITIRTGITIKPIIMNKVSRRTLPLPFLHRLDRDQSQHRSFSPFLTALGTPDFLSRRIPAVHIPLLNLDPVPLQCSDHGRTIRSSSICIRASQLSVIVQIQDIFRVFWLFQHDIFRQTGNQRC